MKTLSEAKATWTMNHAPIEKAYNKAYKAFNRANSAKGFITLGAASTAYYASLSAQPKFIGPLEDLDIMSIFEGYKC